MNHANIITIAAVLAAATAVSAPTGREWEDETALCSGKERPRAAFASFESVEAAKAIRPEFCSRRLLLDSEKEWRFHWCRKPEERPVDFYRPEYDVSEWDVVKVPCSWQAMGINAERKPYDRPYYLNQHWPFAPKFPANTNCWPRVRGHALPEEYTLGNDENPVGSYRRDFEIPEDWSGDEIYLEFGAVDSFFYLWVNGEYVGFSKSSRDPACFNVTKWARPGRNTVALEVYRFSDASYLEAQDMFLLSGLARSVWAYHVPKTHIRDVTFVTSPATKGKYNGDWRLDMSVDVVGGRPGAVAVDVFDAEGRPVAYAGAAGEKASLVFTRPALWSAETPSLYTLVVSLRDEAGATTEAAGFQLGFREVEIRDAADQRDRTFLLNGQPIKMRGANRHETSPLYGHYTPDELIEQDVRMLKQANCNHVRNSHYPQPDYFYYLCNKYGIYVMDEANIESHGLFYGKESISHVKSWEAAHVYRAVNMVERNKCHPCIVIWSLGNEAGPGDNFKACVAAIRARDMSRPVQYERNNWITDMGSRQYPSVDWMWQCARGGEGLSHEPQDKPLRYPFHVNEYAHNMGNAMGNLKDYQDAIESSTRIMGAAIWDWVDQGLYKEGRRKREEGKSDEEVRIIAYGGDFGDRPTAGAFVMNGCVLSDRTPEPGYWEIKHVYQPIVAEKGEDGKSIKVTNRHYFRDTSAYDCTITRLVDGREVSSRSFDMVLPPRDTTVIPVQDATGSYRIAFTQKADEDFWPKGWTIADDQVDFSAPLPCETPKGHLEFGFSPETGELVSIKSGRFFGTELLAQPLTLDIWRAAVHNEAGWKHVWDKCGFSAPVRKLVAFSDNTGHDGVRHVKSIVDYAVTDTVFRVESDWTIADGAARIKAIFTQSGTKREPAHIGFRTVLRGGSMPVEWLGRGPFENYSDRMSGAFLGLWKLKSDEFFFPYDVPQDCGNREGTYRVTLSPGWFDDLTVESASPFAFEVNPYAPETLVEYAHPAELPDSESTYFGIFAKSRGLGGNSCGPNPLARDIIGEGPYMLELTIR